MDEQPDRGRSGERLDDDVADAHHEREASEPPLREEETERARRATKRPSPGHE
ncbi:MAG TPA: hypothetical protein VGV40_06005 [Solirubrobacteraceae bacterium]|nr:hypothetical protein [Solirubrobacteraceae bacterium]